MLDASRRGASGGRPVQPPVLAPSGRSGSRLPRTTRHGYRPGLDEMIRDRGTAVPAPPGQRIDPGSLWELPPEDHAVKRTFQPNTRRRARKHGFRTRMRTRAGRAIVKARRLKGRRKLTA
jgi:large subunit ribosomal protein L34